MLLFVGASADLDDCAISHSYKNVIVNIDYQGADPLASGRSIFRLGWSAVVPGVDFPNRAFNGSYDVHAFFVVNPSSNALKPVHMDFGVIMGGANRDMQFSVVNAMVNDNSCIDIAFYYKTQAGAENYFVAKYSLSNKSRRDVVAEDEIAARDVCTLTLPAYDDWQQSSTDPNVYTNSYYFQKTGTVTAVTYSVANGYGITPIPISPTTGYFASPTATQRGSIGFSGCYTNGNYNMSITVSYKCGGVWQSNVTGYKNLIVF